MLTSSTDLSVYYLTQNMQVSFCRAVQTAWENGKGKMTRRKSCSCGVSWLQSHQFLLITRESSVCIIKLNTDAYGKQRQNTDNKIVFYYRYLHSCIWYSTCMNLLADTANKIWLIGWWCGFCQPSWLKEYFTLKSLFSLGYSWIMKQWFSRKIPTFSVLIISYKFHSE